MKEVVQSPASILVSDIAYKKNENDMRESPAIPIIQLLVDTGYVVQYYDPFIFFCKNWRYSLGINSFRRIHIETGGAGFIGSNLAEELVKRVYQVTIVDNFYKGKSSYHTNLMDFIPIIPVSVLEKGTIYELVQQLDVAFHLAAILGVKTTMEKSIKLIETNFDGTRNILQVALAGKKKVIFASTSEV